jgi:hypothetical protein
MLRRRWLSVTTAFLMLSCILLSSCTPPDESPKDIAIIVTSYLTQIQDGMFAEKDLLSTFTKDDPFKKVVVPDKSLESVMLDGMELIEFTVGEAVGTAKEATGTCPVEITMPDVEAAAQEVHSVDELQELYASGDVPMKTVEIVFDMAYDETAKTWSIKDSSEIAKLLGFPYMTIEILPDTLGVAEAYMQGIIQGDAEEIAKYGFVSTYEYFYSEDEPIQRIAGAYFRAIEYELSLTDDPDATTGLADNVEIVLTVPDIYTLDAELMADKDFLLEFCRVWILALQELEDEDAAWMVALDYYADAIIERLEDPDVMTITYQGEISFYYGVDIEINEDGLFVEEEPESLYILDSMLQHWDDNFVDECLEETFEQLIDEGLLTRQEMEDMYGSDS